MTVSTEKSDPQVSVSLLLCQASYCDNPDQIGPNGEYIIQTQVSLVLPGYTVVWSSPITADYNYAYLAVSPANEYYFVVRGSLPFEGIWGEDPWGGFYNWIVEDFNVLCQDNWPYSTESSIYVADGSMTAFDNIMNAVDIMGSGDTALEALTALAVGPNLPIIITGHSLGGNIANMYASYLANQAQNWSSEKAYLITFAAPAAGNTAFVDDLQNKFLADNTYHYEIDNDIVPKFPVYDDLNSTVANLYAPSPQAQEITLDPLGLVYLSTVIQDFAGLIDDTTEGYSQTTDLVLAQSVSGDYPANTVWNWFYEAEYHHAITSYISVLAPEVKAQSAQLIPLMTQAKSAYFGAEKTLRVDTSD